MTPTTKATQYDAAPRSLTAPKKATEQQQQQQQ